MDTKKNTGGPAFPIDDLVQRDEKGHLFGPQISSAGMSLRDYFAVHIEFPVSEIVKTFEAHTGETPTYTQLAEAIAHLRYLLADAMLAERLK